MAIVPGNQATAADVLLVAEDCNGTFIKKFKAVDEVLNNSNVLQNDDDLYFDVAAGETWAFEIVLFYLSGTTPDFKYALTSPVGGLLRANGIDLGSWINIFLASGDTQTADGQGITEGTHDLPLIIKGYIKNSVNAGDLRLQWAQNVADASNTTVLRGSYLLARREA